MLKKIFGSLEVKENEVIGIASTEKLDRKILLSVGKVTNRLFGIDGMEV